jgi:hypothetical protein
MAQLLYEGGFSTGSFSLLVEVLDAEEGEKGWRGLLYLVFLFHTLKRGRDLTTLFALDSLSRLTNPMT